jgi:hypothetical protein
MKIIYDIAARFIIMLLQAENISRSVHLAQPQENKEYVYLKNETTEEKLYSFKRGHICYLTPPQLRRFPQARLCTGKLTALKNGNF